ncbi:MAG: KH domain-containing protein [Candidatus Micrarchaeia archaeon]
MEIVKIPKERIGVLLGEGGKTKKRIEETATITLRVNSEGEIILEGEEDKIYFGTEVIKAIGRGFSPDDAIKIITKNKSFFMINLKEFANTPNATTRIKARVIGENGKVKSEIESATGCTISVYGKTIGIIGDYDSIEYAKEAITKIIKGSQHSTIFNYLADARRKIIQERLK